MKVKFVTPLIISLIVGIALLAWLLTPPPSNNRARALILKQTKGLVSIDKTFPSIANLQGFLVHFNNAPNNQAIIYADKQGRYLLMGHIISADGKNLTLKESNRYIHDRQMDNAFTALKNTHGVWQGKRDAPHAITLLIDPNSPLFPKQYESLETYVADGKLAINWVLVSYLKPNGAGVAAAILQAKNPEQALARNASEYHQQSQSGGMPALQIVTPALQRQLDDNWNFMQTYKFNSSPISFFKTKDGKVHVVRGFLFDEMLEGSVLPSITPRDTE